MSPKKQKLTIVIDGPAGAGKSTVSQALAKKLGYLYLDSGALYRCIALKSHEKKIPPKNTKALFLFSKRRKIQFKKGSAKQLVFLDGKNVTQEIRTPQVSKLASQYARLPLVRRALLHQQRKVGQKGGIVGEGRDLGTVVFPKADLKFFLVATLKERTKRRFLELQEKFPTQSISLPELKKEIQKRDRQDAARALAPLKKAKDAISVDPSAMTIDEVISTLYKKINVILRAKGSKDLL